MVPGFGPILETDRLRAESLKLREEAIRTRIRAAESICSLIETQARSGLIEKARLAMPKIWHVTEEIRRHIDEPGHVSSTAADELRGRLARLENTAANVAGLLDAD